FNCVIHTDGYGISFIFVRKKKTFEARAVLDIQDFETTEVNKHFIPITVDPGKNQIFTAVIGSDTKSHQIRTCSKEERRNKYLKALKERKSIKPIEAAIPSPKVSNKANYVVYATYMLTNLQMLLDFHGYKSAQFNFNSYQGKQRVDSEVTNILLDGGKKYNIWKRKNINKKKKRKRKKKSK
ncbi:MAG: hypothetical protein EXX96DRAFT_450598, partial [Benjaminiella poitrasii]